MFLLKARCRFYYNARNVLKCKRCGVAPSQLRTLQRPAIHLHHFIVAW